MHFWFDDIANLSKKGKNMSEMMKNRMVKNERVMYSFIF